MLNTAQRCDLAELLARERGCSASAKKSLAQTSYTARLQPYRKEGAAAATGPFERILASAHAFCLAP